MLKIIKNIGNWKIWSLLGGLFLVLVGMYKYQKVKNNNLERELIEKEAQIDIKSFEGEQRTLKEQISEKLKEQTNETNDDRLDGDTSYRL